MRSLLALMPLSLLACVEEPGPPSGTFDWDVTITGIEDLCNPTDPQGSLEEVTYSLLFDGSLTSIYIGPDLFAQGIMSGCALEYDSPVVGERRGENEEFWVKWQITGDATLRQGGSSCDIVEEGIDWVGEETFEIVETDDPSLQIGCTYTMSVVGTFTGRNG
ncbi:MAG: hypothetical protein ABIO70_22045 [Pseudomonadota bacterium]